MGTTSSIERVRIHRLTSIPFSLELGRFDLKLPSYVVDQLSLALILEPILAHLRTIMRTSSRPILRTHNIVFAPVGSTAQNWHCDDSFRSCKNGFSYFTVLIHLNPIDEKCGGTEIWSKTLKRSDMVRMKSPSPTLHRFVLVLETPLSSMVLFFIADKQISATPIDSFIMQVFLVGQIPMMQIERNGVYF